MTLFPLSHRPLPASSRATAAPLTHGDSVAALTIFFINSLICLIFFGPERQGYSDVVRGWQQFNERDPILVPEWGPDTQIELRILLVIFTLLETLVLRVLGLIDRRTLAAYLALPVSAYLASRIRLEFLFFPLALISTRLTVKKELAVIATVLGLSIMLDEQNGYVIAAFRVMLLALRVRDVPWIILGAALAGVVAVTNQFELIARALPSLASYSYTRDVANPEYSVIETVGVLVSSMVLSINPYIDFAISIPTTLLVMFVSLGPRAFDRRFWRPAVQSAEFKAFVVTVVTFTSITHAFQNARYYFFFLPLLAAALGGRGVRRLMALSVPATIAMAVYYSTLSAENRMILEQLVELWGTRL